MQRQRRKALAKSRQREQNTAYSLLKSQDPLSRALPALSSEAILGSMPNEMILSSTSRDPDLMALMNFF